MREKFHEHLDALIDDLIRQTLMVETAMGRATIALLDADADLADQAVQDAASASVLREAMDQRAVELVARQQPVAGDLRILVAALRMTADLEHTGALARHVADVARDCTPQSAVPESLRDTIEHMGFVAKQITATTRRAIGAQAWKAADGLERADDEMDDLLKSLYSLVLRDSLCHTTGTTVDLALLGRYYERYADHAVSAARRVVYLTSHASSHARKGSARRQLVGPDGSATVGAPSAGQY